MSLPIHLGAGLYHVGVRLAAPFSPKARAWVLGRRGLWERLEAKRAALQGCLWMHCASVGEFEQGRPVLEALHARHPGLPILITFFSPSGYQARKQYPIATHVDYLPPDGAAHARRLMQLLGPRAVLWVKYDFWPHHLAAIQRAGVPLFLVSAIFRRGQPFFRWYGAAWRRMLHGFTHIFTQDEASRTLLAGIGITRATVSGDTRFDRVAAIVREGATLPIAQAFHRAMDAPVLVAGSTWPADASLIAAAFQRMRRPPRLVLVPHEPTPHALDRASRAMPKPVERYGHLEERIAHQAPVPVPGMPPEEDPLFARTLLVDRLGILARLYQHADVAYVGGGFGNGIHSILEAAAWGRPVIFGPRHRKFPEAQGLIDAGGGFEVRDADELAVVLARLCEQPLERLEAGKAAEAFVRERTGATARVVEAIAPTLYR